MNGKNDDDVWDLAESVGVVRFRVLRIVASCAAGCGASVPEGQVMCTGCATK